MKLNRLYHSRFIVIITSSDTFATVAVRLLYTCKVRLPVSSTGG